MRRPPYCISGFVGAVLLGLLAGSAWADEPASRLTQVEVRENEDTTEIVLKGTKPPTFTVFKLSDPTRLFIDVAGADISAIETPVAVENGVLGQITALQFSDDVVTVGRLIVGLEVDAPYSVKAQGNDLVVTLDASARTVRKPVAAKPAGAGDGAAVAAAEARVREAERRAEEASQRAREAEDRARLAEDRARGADDRANELAQARVKDSAARGTADAARQSAEAQAREAAAQVAEAAARAKEAEARAAVAEARAREAEARAAAAESVARTRAAEAEAAGRVGAAGVQDAAQAQARARAVAQEAAEAEARAREAETRSREAEARAAALAKEVAEARSQVQTAEARAQQAAQAAAARVAAADETAQARIAQAEARIRSEAEARAAADQAASARILAEAESRIQAEAAARAAADQAAEARIQAARAAADQAAEARVRVANENAAAADTRALQAARDSEAKARIATQTAQKAQEAAGRLAEAEKRADEAETRAARAESRAARAEAEKQRLAADLASLEQQRTDAVAQMARLESEQVRLSSELAGARAANDAERTRVLEAEERARAAALASEQARVAQLESAKAASVLDQRVAGLEGQLEAARAADRTEEVKRLQAELGGARSEGGTLRSALQSREDELAAARVEAERSRADAARLAAALAEAREMVANANRPEPVPVVPVAAPETAAPIVVAAPESTRVVAAPETAAPIVVAAPESTRVVAAPETVAPVVPPPPAVSTVRITNVKFDDSPERTTIRVTFSGRPVYRVTPEGERTRVLEFQNARIDPALERTLDTSEFQSAVQIVSSFQAPPPGDQVRVVVTLSEAVADEVTLTGDTLTWNFARPRVSRPVVSAVPPPPAWSAPPPPAPVKFEQPEAAAFTAPLQTVATFGGQNRREAPARRYSGRRINIDIKDGDIHNILRLLAKEGNVNIVTSDDVAGTVTVHLKSVPWDQALDIILQTKSLGMVRDGDIVRVAPADVLAKERDLELQQQEVKEKLKPLVVKLIPVNYAEAQDLLQRVQAVLSTRGKADFDKRTNTLIVKDVRENVEAAEDIVSRLDSQTPQVLIEARIVEVNTVDSLQLGIQWGGDALLSPALGNGTGLRFPSVVGVRGGADDTQAPTAGVATVPNFVVNLPAAAGGGSGGALGLTFGSIDGAFNLNVRLSAFENRGTVKIVSSPKIATLDNVEATISQGVSIPISQVSAAGTQTVFFDAVLKLIVTPHVTQDGNIYLKIKAENNTPDFQNVGARGDPTILKKEATTELLLKDGDTTVIGGIYTSNAGQNSSEVPYLAQIPILGAIFRNYQETDRRTELLIFVTPKIVNRSAAKVRTAN